MFDVLLDLLFSPPVTGEYHVAFIGSLVSFAGGLLSNRSNRKEASANRRFQEHQSNTAYQRGVEDMKKAGLNPALAYSQGGASTPSGSQANLTNPFAEAGNSALSQKRLYEDIKTMKSQRKLISAQARKANAEATPTAKNAPIYDAQNRVLNKVVPMAEKGVSSAVGAVRETKKAFDAPLFPMFNKKYNSGSKAEFDAWVRSQKKGR